MSATPSIPGEPLLFTDALVVTQDAQRRVVRADVRVDEGRFTHVGPNGSRSGATRIAAQRYAIVPGFINTHTHVAMSPLRAIADERDLAGFLEVLFRVDADRTEADIEAGAAMGIAEMLLSGTTSFLDLYYGEDAVARAVKRWGIRGFLGWAVLDPERTTQRGLPLDNARAFLMRWQKDPRITPLVAPQGVYACNEETWLKARALSEEFGTLLHYHISETRKEVHEHEAKTGKRPVVWLDDIGLLGPKQVGAHAVWLTGDEIQRLARRKVGVAHCPSSNLKLASGGCAPVVELAQAGVTVGLGTDSVASNNSLSMLREMHVAGLLQKNQRWDARVLPAQRLLDMATLDGARLLGREADLGSIEVGKRADFSLVALDHPSLAPPRPEAVVSHLAYSAWEEAITSVYVDGECVLSHRQLARGSFKEIRDAFDPAADRLWSRRSG